MKAHNSHFLIRLYCKFKSENKGVTQTILISLFLYQTCLLFMSANGQNAHVNSPHVLYKRINVVENDFITGTFYNYYFLYYLAERDEKQPSLVVRLGQTESGKTIAEVFDAPPNMDYVPVQWQEDTVALVHGLTPTIRIVAVNGWWVNGRKINYDLDITVYGGIYAMWGAGYDPKFGESGWTTEILDGEPSVKITVRDPDSEGLPRWDLRQLLPRFHGRGYYRVNYAERKCESPLQVIESVSPEWPYVAAFGTFEQPVGYLSPPIVVDWEQARITHFAELVTVRNQNCSYSLYSIDPIEPETLNRPNFETPFAFYDLSGEGVGYPNLLLRTERFAAGDAWLNYPRPNPQDYLEVRYSWRNQVGDQLWDYKIDVLGSNPYNFETSIADNSVLIDAPDYENFPDWVVTNSWPVITFVDTEGNSYRSSEGLYDWSTRPVGRPLFRENSVLNPEQAYSNIRPGFRGQYYVGDPISARLYMSPVDYRLHLKGAQGGLWNLDDRWAIRLRDIEGNGYIDSWELTSLDERFIDDDIRVQDAQLPGSSHETILSSARLVDLGDHLLYSEGSRIILSESNQQPIIFETTPPTDKTSWKAFRAMVLPYESLRREPIAFREWIESFPGPTLTIEGALLNDLHIIDDIVHLILTVPEAAYTNGDLYIPAIQDLSAGKYLVTYNRRLKSWISEAAVPAQIRATLTPNFVRAFEPSQLTISVENLGNIDLRGRAFLRIGDEEPEHWDDLVLSGGDTYIKTISWTPDKPRNSLVELIIGDEIFPLGTIDVPAPPRALGISTFRLSVHAPNDLAIILLVTSFFASMSLWYAWRNP
jgi:hypothetical protein